MSNRSLELDEQHLPLGMSPRTVFVMGKGGVGKSTVSAALALAWRDAGARTLLVEIEGHASTAAILSPQEIAYEPTPIGERLSAMRITLMDALREYARLRLKMRLVADRLVSNPIIDQFTNAAPGFRDLLILGKLYQLYSETDDRGRRKWDAIVVDAPATGHGLGMLNMAGVIARMFPVGPIASEARMVDEFTRDPEKCGVVLVTLPEELPVTETLELRAALAEQNLHTMGCVVNALLVDRFSANECDVMNSALNDLAAEQTELRAALETAVLEHQRCREQAAERARFEAGIDDPVGLLPFMFVPSMELEHVQVLAQWFAKGPQEQLEQQLAGAASGPEFAARFHTDAEATH